MITIAEFQVDYVARLGRMIGAGIASVESAATSRAPTPSGSTPPTPR